MKTAQVIVTAAMLASAIPLIARPFDPPRFFCPPPYINNQWQQLQAADERRRTERMMLDQLERDRRVNAQLQENERKEKETLENAQQAASQPPQQK